MLLRLYNLNFFPNPHRHPSRTLATRPIGGGQSKTHHVVAYCELCPRYRRNACEDWTIHSCGQSLVVVLSHRNLWAFASTRASELRISNLVHVTVFQSDMRYACIIVYKQSVSPFFHTHLIRISCISSAALYMPAPPPVPTPPSVFPRSVIGAGEAPVFSIIRALWRGDGTSVFSQWCMECAVPGFGSRPYSAV